MIYPWLTSAPEDTIFAVWCLRIVLCTAVGTLPSTAALRKNVPARGS